MLVSYPLNRSRNILKEIVPPSAIKLLGSEPKPTAMKLLREEKGLRAGFSSPAHNLKSRIIDTMSRNGQKGFITPQRAHEPLLKLVKTIQS